MISCYAKFLNRGGGYRGPGADILPHQNPSPPPLLHPVTSPHLTGGGRQKLSAPPPIEILYPPLFLNTSNGNSQSWDGWWWWMDKGSMHGKQASSGAAMTQSKAFFYTVRIWLSLSLNLHTNTQTYFLNFLQGVH